MGPLEVWISTDSVSLIIIPFSGVVEAVYTSGKMAPEPLLAVVRRL
jgi:hypothetical protein